MHWAVIYVVCLSFIGLGCCQRPLGMYTSSIVMYNRPICVLGPIRPISLLPGGMRSVVMSRV